MEKPEPTCEIEEREDSFLVTEKEARKCEYLPAQRAKITATVPKHPLTQAQMDVQFSAGRRRQGPMLYWNTCPECRACEPIRLDTNRFAMSRTQRRTLRRGQRELRFEESAPQTTEAHAELYNLHREQRGLLGSSGYVNMKHYAFNAATVCETREVRMYHNDTMICVSLMDMGKDSISAVTCSYDLNYGRFSLGTLSVLRQIERVRRTGRRYLYLGLYVEGCDALEYKARYLPHERLLDGEWKEFPARHGD